MWLDRLMAEAFQRHLAGFRREIVIDLGEGEASHLSLRI